MAKTAVGQFSRSQSGESGADVLKRLKGLPGFKIIHVVTTSTGACQITYYGGVYQTGSAGCIELNGITAHQLAADEGLIYLSRAKTAHPSETIFTNGKITLQLSPDGQSVLQKQYDRKHGHAFPGGRVEVFSDTWMLRGDIPGTIEQVRAELQAHIKAQPKPQNSVVA